jgi:hypothetical protein
MEAIFAGPSGAMQTPGNASGVAKLDFIQSYGFPKIYNQNKYFYAPQWEHTFVYKNVNDISVTMIEDPLGVRRTY